MLFYSSRKRKKAAEMLRTQVVKGAYVMLTSGIFGKVANVMDDRIELETSPGQKLTVAIGAVRGIEQEPKPSKAQSKPASKSATKPSAKTTPKKK
jgi:preprotein translocase YajC subunit